MEMIDKLLGFVFFGKRNHIILPGYCTVAKEFEKLTQVLLFYFTQVEPLCMESREGVE